MDNTDSKAAGQVSNQRLCLRSQRGLGLRRWVVEPATSLPFRSRGDVFPPTKEKIDSSTGGFKADQLSTRQKKAVAFDRDQIVGARGQRIASAIFPTRF